MLFQEVWQNIPLVYCVLPLVFCQTSMQLDTVELAKEFILSLFNAFNILGLILSFPAAFPDFNQPMVVVD